MMTAIAILLFLVFLFLSLLHFYWGFGGNWRTKVVFPTKDDNIPTKNPGPIPTFIVALGLLGFGFFVLAKYDAINVGLPAWLEKFGAWIIAGIFIVRAIGDFKYVGFFKKYKQTKFGQYDIKYYSPLSLAIGILLLILELLD
jgi:Protein of unknown function (DUF3995)